MDRFAQPKIKSGVEKNWLFFGHPDLGKIEVNISESSRQKAKKIFADFV